MVRDDESVRLRAPLRCWHESLVSARADALITLSREGAFIATSRPVPAGTELFLEISLDGNGATAELDAVAVAAATSDEGFAVRFLGIDDRARDLLERVLSAERPPALVVPAPSLPPPSLPPSLTTAAPVVAAGSVAVDVEVTDRMERPANVPAPPSLANLDETQPFAVARPAMPTSQPRAPELPRAITVNMTTSPPLRSPSPSSPPSSPSPPSWLNEATSDGSVDETRPWAAAPRAQALHPGLDHGHEANPAPPSPFRGEGAVNDATPSSTSADQTRSWAAAPGLSAAPPRTATPAVAASAPGLPAPPPLVLPRTATPAMIVAVNPFAPSASPARAHLPKIASLEMPAGPPLPAVEETMRWPTARGRVAEVPPALSAPPLPVPAPPAFAPAPPAVAPMLGAEDDDDHPSIAAPIEASGASLFGASGDLLGDPNDTDFGVDIEATDPGVGPSGATPPINTAEDVPLESLAGRPLDTPTLEDEQGGDVVELSDLDDYRDVLGAATAPAVDVRPGSTQPYLTLKGAEGGLRDAPTARLPAFSMPLAEAPPQPAFEQPAYEAPAALAMDFNPFAPLETPAPPRLATDVLVPGAFESAPGHGPAMMPPPSLSFQPPPRSDTEMLVPPPFAPPPLAPSAWSGAPPAEPSASELASPFEAPFAISMPTAQPAPASPVSALLGNDVGPSWPADDDGEVLSLDSPVEGGDEQIASFFDDLAFQGVEPQPRGLEPQPSSSWQINEQPAAPELAEEEIPLIVGEDLPVVAASPANDPFNGLEWIVGEPGKK